MQKPVGYSVASYGEMITLGPRAQAYAAALRRAIRPGCTVLEIGAGTGFFSLLACQLGAARVHAVEPDPSIEIARASAAANGFSDRITFHSCLSTDLQLDEPADVVVSDLRSILPLLQFHIPSIVDARRRLLRPGGIQIPVRDQLWAALVEDEKLHARQAEPWTKNDYGLNLSAAHRFVVNNWRKVYVEPERLIVPPLRWATIDYCTVENPKVAGEASWTIERASTAHGLLLWFDAELAPDIGFSNAPGEPRIIYGQCFFPLEAAVSLERGDRVAVKIRADLASGDYVWSWATTVTSGDGAVKARFTQSSFLGQIRRSKDLSRRSSLHVPAPSPTLEIDRRCLEQVDGRRSLEDIARSLAARFPDRFSTWQAALGHVVELLDGYENGNSRQ